MLIARAPVRISFAGGGTDLEAYYGRHGGMVVSTTIDKYFYVFVNLNGSDSLQITSSDYRTFYRHEGGEPIPWEGDLALPRAVLHQFGITSGISMFLASEVPPGTGLGSSSTVTVAIVKALATLQALRLTRGQIAEVASFIEIDKLGMPIGRQDQYAAAVGGLNAFTFSPHGVSVEPIRMEPEVRDALERRVMMFFTGASRAAADILGEQEKNSRRDDGDAVRSLHRIKEAAVEMRATLQRGDLTAFGELLDAGWQEKKKLARGISNAAIDDAYAAAREAGAAGGKIAGAGGGGFLMLYCEERHQARVTRALGARGLTRMDFRFDDGGATVLVNALPRIKAFGRPELSFLGEGRVVQAS